MGRHASAERRRTVAAWPILVGVVALLLVGAAVLYFRVINRDGRDTAGCDSTVVLPVIVGPGAAPAVEQAARAFNATTPVARSTCVSVSVSTVSGPAAVAALAGGWQGQRTPGPGLWIADSTADVAALDTASPAMTAGHPAQGLASSPVVLAVRQAPVGAPVSWASLARGSTSLVLGIADPGTNRASAAALESLVRGASGSPTAAAGIDDADVESAGPVLARLAGTSSSVPATTDLALTGLAAGTSRYTAVPALESDLATFNSASGTPPTAVYPTGPTAAGEVMPVPLTASWVTSTMSDAAAAFDGYLGNEAGTKIFAAAHLRTTGARVAAGGVDLRTPVAALADPSATSGAALNAAWRAALSKVGTARPAGSAVAADPGVATTAETSSSSPVTPLTDSATGSPSTT